MAHTPDNLYDVVVIGGGPAGLTAGLYLARARYRVAVVERQYFGGQIVITDEVVNYPGIPKASGAEITEAMRRQAQDFGAELLSAEVRALELEGDIKTVRTDRGDLRCFGVLLATGASPRTVGFPGEEAFRGKGVAYCATCDGGFFTGKDIFVVGGGYAAAEEAVFLTRYARSVTILIRGGGFSCAAAVADEARAHEKIKVLTHTQVVEAGGDTALRYLVYRNSVTGETVRYEAPAGDTFGLFVFAGYAPATELVRALGVLDDRGYVMTDLNRKTAAEGLWAAGDVCVKNLRQIATAVGDGATAASELEKYAKRMQEKTGLRPVLPTPAAPKAAVQAAPSGTESGLLTDEMRAQLSALFAKLERPLLLRLTLDDRPVSGELRALMEELASLTDKLTLQEASGDAADADAPCVRVLRANGTPLGMAFHGAPGGHEFNSFVLGLYNAAGPGQPMDAAVLSAVRALDKPADLKILVSLSCTMCPELVTAAQRIAAENPKITAQVYDLNHFPALQEQYHVMSVPCLVVNDGQIVSFGKKSVTQLAELLGGSTPE